MRLGRAAPDAAGAGMELDDELPRKCRDRPENVGHHTESCFSLLKPGQPGSVSVKWRLSLQHISRKSAYSSKPTKRLDKCNPQVATGGHAIWHGLCATCKQICSSEHIDCVLYGKNVYPKRTLAYVTRAGAREETKSTITSPSHVLFRFSVSWCVFSCF